MGKIAETMKGWVKPQGGATISDALNYIETGDPAALDRVHAFRVWEYWKEHLTSVMAVSEAMGEEDRRALSVLAAAEEFGQVGRWLSRAMAGAKGDEDLHAIVREELEAAGWSKAKVRQLTMVWVRDFARGGRPNSAGRYLLSLSDRDLNAAAKKALDWGKHWDSSLKLRLAEFLLDAAPERLGPLLDVILDPKGITPQVCELIVRTGAGRYDSAVIDVWRKAKDPAKRREIGRSPGEASPRGRAGPPGAAARSGCHHVGGLRPHPGQGGGSVRDDHRRRLAQGQEPGGSPRDRRGPDAANPERYGRDEMLEVARPVLADPKLTHLYGDAGVWMVRNHGAFVLDEVVAFLNRTAPSRVNMVRVICVGSRPRR